MKLNFYVAKSAATQARKELYKAGVIARKEEGFRKKRVAQLLKAKEVVPQELQEPILDLETLAKFAQATTEEIDNDNSSSEEAKESEGESILFMYE